MTHVKTNKPNWIQYATLGVLIAIIVCLSASLAGNEEVSTAHTGISQEEFDKVIGDKQAEASQTILGLQKEIAMLKVIKTDSKDSNITNDVKQGYTIKDLFIGEGIEKDLSDRDLITLFDGNVDFDGDDFGARELISINGIRLETNREDFDSNAYLIVDEGSFGYTFEIKSALDTSEIGNDDEYLMLNLLGESYEISKWDNNEVTLRSI